MKKTRRLFIILFTIFLVSTGITLWIIYSNVNHSASTVFVIGYTVFVVLFFIYTAIFTISRLRKLSWPDILKRIYRFFGTFVILAMLSIIFNRIFKSSDTSFSGSISVVVGVALGIAFFDLAFIGKKSDE